MPSLLAETPKRQEDFTIEVQTPLAYLLFVIHDYIMSPSDGAATPTRSRSSKAPDDLRFYSKKLFGNADRLAVAEAVARSTSGVFHAQELSDDLGISPPRVRAQLLAFADAGVVEALPKMEVKQPYHRVDGAFWTFITALIDSWK